VLGILGILLSLALLMYLAYRGVNVLLLAPIMALLALVFNAGPDPALMLGTYTQFYMAELGKYLAKFFPLFMLGALFGKLMDDSGCARVIAHRIVAFTGKSRAILAVVLACGVLTYGGVSLFVVAFAVYPIARQLFREADIPKRLIPACVAAGVVTDGFAAAVCGFTVVPVWPSITAALVKAIAAVAINFISSPDPSFQQWSLSSFLPRAEAAVPVSDRSDQDASAHAHLR